jgi:crotonobetainyl-CoA:carnitine CoA-transferase CaiB-like acyl-CoA transferase
VCIGSLARSAAYYANLRDGARRRERNVPVVIQRRLTAEFIIVVGNDGQFEGLCRAIGRPELAKDERFVTNGARVRHKPSLEDAFAKEDRATWMERLREANVPAGPINTIPEVFANPQVVDRGLLLRLPHALAGEVPQVANPLCFDGKRSVAATAPPVLGADTDAVLTEIGVTREQLQRLGERGVV